MNWKSFVEKKNAETYVLPAGWDSRDKVADQLGCSPDKVDSHLSPALKSGEVQKQQFRVWDGTRLVFVVAYSVAKESTRAVGNGKAWNDEDYTKAVALKKAGKSYAFIGKTIGRTRDSVKRRLQRG